jgi:hypothetical protein
MSKKLLGVLTAAIVVMAGAVSANAKSHEVQQPNNTASVCNPYAGTVYDGVYPHGGMPRSCDPLANTKWEGWGPL